MRILLLLFFLCCITTINSQTAFSAKKIIAQQLPKTIKFRGKFVEAWTWKDNLGENILILSELGPYTTKKGGAESDPSIELFANHYYKKDTGYKQLWRMNDIEKECSVDLAGNFIKGSTSITDLDKDGTAETIVQYRLLCTGDPSPAYMKLIMHEDSVKYALRGNMWLDISGENKKPPTEKDVNLEKLPGYNKEEDWEKAYGRYETEKDFLKAPQEFLTFARKQWLRFMKEEGYH